MNMALQAIVRRKWIYLVLIGVFIVCMTLIIKMHMNDLQQIKIPEAQHEVFLDPQRNLPQKSKLYDWDVNCNEEDFTDTKFMKYFTENYNGTIPEISVIETLSLEELAVIYHTFIENAQYLCKNILRLGKLIDGGWEVCHETEFIPKPPCIVYSFGINNDFSFDDAVINKYGCMVHSFDPSMDTASYKRNELNYFHSIGLSSENIVTKDGWRLSRLATIRSDLGHSKKRISILKMDIELWEWDVLPDMIDSGVLNDVDSLLIEFHLNLIAPPTESGKSIYLRGVKLLKRLYDLGFRIFFTHKNPSLVFHSKCRKIQRVNCHEVSFVRVKNV